MSNYIPFDIQAETMKRLPVKSLILFRSVSKSWKSLIDSSIFIKNHHIHQTQTQPQHLFLRYKLRGCDDETCVSLIDDDTFPDHKFFHTIPESVNLLKRAYVYSSSHGVLCFFGPHRDLGSLMVVLWNPAIRKSVDIFVPNTPKEDTYTVVGFGVNAATNDPKLVRIDVIFWPCVHWEVEIFTLSSRAWKSLSINPPFRFCYLTWYHVLIEAGFVYWLGYDDHNHDGEDSFNSIISFDLKNDEFGEVCLPDSVVHSCNLLIFNHKESLAVVNYNAEAEIPVCGVWVMDKVTKSFTRMFSVISMGRLVGFKKNGEAIMMISRAHNSDLDCDDDDVSKLICKCQLYVTSSGHMINAIGLKGNFDSFFMITYTETLLLLDQPNSICRPLINDDEALMFCKLTL